MKSLPALVAAAAVAAASFALGAGPADAGGRPRHPEYGDHHYLSNYWRYGNPYFRYYEPRRFGEPIFGRKAHVRWCLERHHTYIPTTNLYVDSWGRRRRCNSPFD
jgi:hypothetical protein